MKKGKWIKWVLQRSEDREFVDAVLEAALTQKRELYPEWDIAYFALEKNRGKEVWEEIYKILNPDVAEEENVRHTKAMSS